MNKIKTSSLIVFAFLLLGAVGLHGRSVNAAVPTPGCYVKYSATSTTKVDCPSSLATQAAQTCFVSTDPDRDRAASSYAETACTSFVATDEGESVDDPGVSLDRLNLDQEEGKHICGRGPTDTDKSNEVKVSFDFGCVGDKYDKFSGTSLNPILDIAFALFRFFSAGVGLVVIGSIIVAGIQYTSSRGDPQATGAAIKRISNSLIALLIYIFMFAIANFIVPGGMFI
jgi:hypothetical protein